MARWVNYVLLIAGVAIIIVALVYGLAFVPSSEVKPTIGSIDVKT